MLFKRLCKWSDEMGKDDRIMHSSHESIIYEKREFFIYLLCLVAAVGYSLTNISIIGILATCIICICVFYVPDNDVFPFIFGLQFLRIVIPFSIGSGSYGFILFVYCCLFVRLIKKRYAYIDYIPLVFLLLLDIMTSAADGIFKIGDNINWIGSLVYVIYILKVWKDEVDYEKLLVYFCLAEWTVCLINILAEYRIFGQSLIPTMYGGFTSELGAFAFGKAYAAVAGGNGISFNNALAIALCVIQFSRTTNFTRKVFFAISSVFFLYTGFMVISRGFYIELAIFITLYILSLIKRPKMFLSIIVVLSVLGTIFYGYFYDDLLSVFVNVTQRFEAGNADRSELINNAQILLSSNWKVLLFGGGSYYPDTYGFTCHNLFWDSFVSLGIVGLIVYWGSIIKAVFCALKNRVCCNIVAFIPMIMLVSFKTISGSIRDVGFYYYIALVVIFAIDYCKYRVKDVENYE